MQLPVDLHAVNLSTRADRLKRGKELRRGVPRGMHADLKGLDSRERCCNPRGE